MIIKVNNKLCIDLRAREWCKLPYPNHSKGCPCYGKKDTCPPKIKIVGEIFNLNKDLWFVIEKFDLKVHAVRMKQKHPNWSDKQCKCVLYWQAGVRKKLRILTEEFVKDKDYIWTNCPEAMGVNVFKTFHKLGLVMKRNPDIVNKVALVGFPKS